MEWEVNCPKCGVFIQVQKGDPTICPKCGEPDIDTRPVDRVPDDLQAMMPDLAERNWRAKKDGTY